MKIFKDSLKAVISFKIRTFFSILAISIGIASLSIIVASVEGAYGKAYEIVNKFGPDSMMIFGGSQEITSLRQRQKTITLEIYQDITQKFPEIKLSMPLIFIPNVKLSYQDKKHNTRLIGASEKFSEIWSWNIDEGRLFSKEEIDTKANVCIIGKTVKKELFSNEEAVGKYITLNNLVCKVIGVLSERGSTPTGEDLDDRVMMPYTTIMSKINHDNKYIDGIRLKLYKDVDIGDLTKKIEQYFKQRNIDVFILTPQEILNFLLQLTGSLVLFLGLSSTISLTIGGFVLANLFLLSVNERTHEIGIRRAVGATKRDILKHFIYEALIITFIASIIGFLIGFGGSKLLVKIIEFPVKFSWISFIFAVIVSLIVGIIAVLNPALKASRINPIEAIKS